MDSNLYMGGPYWEHEDLLLGRYSYLCVCLAESWDFAQGALDAATVRTVDEGFWHEFLWTQAKVRLQISNGYSGESAHRSRPGRAPRRRRRRARAQV